MIKCLSIILFFISNLSFSAEQLKIYLFASSSCEKCRYLKELILPDILETYPQVSYEHIPVDDTENFELQLLYEKLYQQNGYNIIGKEEASVKAFVGKTCLAGVKLIEDRLEDVILTQGNVATPSPEKVRQLFTKKENLVEDKYETFTWLTVAWSGLVDGVNPCAFVTLVFFISVLSNLRKSKRDILIVGTLFSLSVFLTYLLLGLGAFRLIKELSVQSGVAKGINIGTSIFCLTIGVISLFDVIRTIRKNETKFSLKLPKDLRKTINRQISTKMRKGSLWFWAIFLGVAISLLESICTGQIYLPIITTMIKKGNAEAFWLLILYNIMFIVPLIAVFAVTFAGASSEQLTNFFKRHLLLSKILVTTLFFILGLILFLT